MDLVCNLMSSQWLEVVFLSFSLIECLAAIVSSKNKNGLLPYLLSYLNPFSYFIPSSGKTELHVSVLRIALLITRIAFVIYLVGFGICSLAR